MKTEVSALCAGLPRPFNGAEMSANGIPSSTPNVNGADVAARLRGGADGSADDATGYHDLESRADRGECRHDKFHSPPFEFI